MSLATIVCIDPPAYSRRPHLTIPNLGPIEAIWDAVNTIPDPMEIITKFKDSINLALAPVRKYLQMVEAVISIKQCIEALKVYQDLLKNAAQPGASGAIFDDAIIVFQQGKAVFALTYNFTMVYLSPGNS